MQSRRHLERFRATPGITEVGDYSKTQYEQSKTKVNQIKEVLPKWIDSELGESRKTRISKQVEQESRLIASKEPDWLIKDQSDRNAQLMILKAYYMPGDGNTSEWRPGELLDEWSLRGQWSQAIDGGHFEARQKVAIGYWDAIERYYPYNKLKDIKQYIDKKKLENTGQEKKFYESVSTIVEKGINFYEEKKQISIDALYDILKNLDENEEMLDKLDRTHIYAYNQEAMEIDVDSIENEKRDIILEKSKKSKYRNYANRSKEYTKLRSTQDRSNTRTCT